MIELFGMRDFVTEDSPSLTVHFTVGYWRKANQIHSWFVRECQDGVDECQKAYVGIDKLEELREICLRVMSSTKLVPGEVMNGIVWSTEHPKGAVQMEAGQIMEDPREAERLLAPEDGFLFGNQDFDQWYWDDLQRTVTIVDKCVKLDQQEGAFWDFEYQSSW